MAFSLSQETESARETVIQTGMYLYSDREREREILGIGSHNCEG